MPWRTTNLNHIAQNSLQIGIQEVSIILQYMLRLASIPSKKHSLESVMSHNKHPCSYTGYTFMLEFSSYTSLFFGFSSQASQVMENPPCVDVLPSWNLTYPLPRQLWRCASFSEGGIWSVPWRVSSEPAGTYPMLLRCPALVMAHP